LIAHQDWTLRRQKQTVADFDTCPAAIAKLIVDADLVIFPDNRANGTRFHAARMSALQADQYAALEWSGAFQADATVGWVGAPVWLERADILTDTTAGAFVTINV
jgi:hypothetical protein